MSTSLHNFDELQARALGLRIDSMRATTASKSGHPTSCFSAADMVSALFFHAMNADFKNPHNHTNDRFIMSKGHSIPVVYAAYKQLGIISDAELLTLRKVDSPLEGHPTPRFPYNEAATGSLGQGLSIGIGMALQARLDNLHFQTFVMLGDGEIAEGSVWEAAEFAGHHSLNNLTALVDCNRLGQSDHTVAEHDFARVAAKFAAFGWHTIIIDGHEMAGVVQSLADARAHTQAPTVLVAKTLKGFGLDAIQDKTGYHGKPFTDQECTEAIITLKKRFPREASLLEKIETPAQASLAAITAQKTPFTPVRLSN